MNSEYSSFKFPNSRIQRKLPRMSTWAISMDEDFGDFNEAQDSVPMAALDLEALKQRIEQIFVVENIRHDLFSVPDVSKQLDKWRSVLKPTQSNMSFKTSTTKQNVCRLLGIPLSVDSSSKHEGSMWTEGDLQAKTNEELRTILLQTGNSIKIFNQEYLELMSENDKLELEVEVQSKLITAILKCKIK